MSKIPLTQEQVQTLKQFCSYALQNPSIVDDPQLEFFKNFVVEFSATIKLRETSSVEEDTPKSCTLVEEVSQNSNIPQSPADILTMFARRDTSTTTSPSSATTQKPSPATSTITPQQTKPVIATPAPAEQKPVEELSALYIDDMGDDKPMFKMTNELATQVADCAAKGFACMKASEYEKSAMWYGKAVILSCGTVEGPFVGRARALLKMQKPRSAKRDCDKAISLNKACAEAYHVRAMVFKEMGKYAEAKADLEVVRSSKNYSTDVYAELREVNEVIEKEQKRQHETKRVLDEIRKEKVTTGASSVKMPAWVSPEIMEQMSKDPHLLSAFQSPKIAAAVEEIAKNPQAFLKYAGDKEIVTVFMKFTQLMQPKKQTK